LLKAWRATGYRIRLDFLWILDLGITRQRVHQRVAKGGHNIPDDGQLRRFHLGIRNLAELYRPLVNEWRLYDNTGHQPHLVAQEKNGVLELADGARLAFIEESSKERPDRVVSKEKSICCAANSRSRRNMIRPASNAACSAAYGDNPAAIKSAFTNSRHRISCGRNRRT
jgi:hypothetical protein